MQMLDKRTALSGGAVDRQLQPVLQGEARVTFTRRIWRIWYTIHAGNAHVQRL